MKDLEKAIQAVDKNQWLLVFPVPKKREPLSLWHVLYPRSEMRWEWDESGDDRVHKLWHLRRELAESQRLIYSKWYRGRATLFSFQAFKNIWVAGRETRENLHGEAREILDLLEMESPLSTKQIRRGVDLTGKDNERRYRAAMKLLWDSGAIVGIGEIDDGAFPSLAHAATHVVFEELCREADATVAPDAARVWLQTTFQVLKPKRRKMASGN